MTDGAVNDTLSCWIESVEIGENPWLGFSNTLF